MLLWLNVIKELLTLRNFFVVTKKFLKVKFDCSRNCLKYFYRCSVWRFKMIPKLQKCVCSTTCHLQSDWGCNWNAYKHVDLPGTQFSEGALFKYVDQILPIIDRLPTLSWQCCVWEFLYSYEGKYAYRWRFQYHLKSVYKMMCWFAGPMRQMTCWPSIRCSKFCGFFS